MTRTYNHALSLGELRVLILEPGIQSDPIYTRLVVANINDRSLQYNALSYTLDNQLPSVTIICNGEDVRITQNVAEALQALRLEDRPLNLWIDQLCINQTDIDERSHQVAFMGDIYTHTVRTIIWLGQFDENTALAFAMLNLLVSFQNRRIANNQTSQPIPIVGLNHSPSPDYLPPYNSPEFQSLLLLLSRPWFHRIWTFQEGALANDLSTIHCGNHSIPIDHFEVATTLIKRCGYWAIMPWDHPAQLVFARSFRNGAVKPGSSQRSLDTLLGSNKKLQCSDPRDRIYALLSLTTPEYRRKVTPDYARSVAEVYTSATRASIQVEGTLTVLSHVDHFDGPDHTSDLPSWVPDWRDARSSFGVFFGYRSEGSRYYNASADHKPIVLPPREEDSCLRIRGRRFKRITARIKQDVCPRRMNFDLDHSYWDFEPWHNSFSEAATRLLPPSFHTSNSNPPTTNSDFLTHTNGTANKPKPAEIHAVSLRRLLSADLYPRPSHSREKDLAEHFPALNSWVLAGMPGHAPPNVLREHDRLINNVMRSRNLYLIGGEDEESMIAIAPIDVQVNIDWVCVLFGGDAPFILRPIGIKGGEERWMLIGECYVQGIMDGEAMAGVEERGFETFVIE